MRIFSWFLSQMFDDLLHQHMAWYCPKKRWCILQSSYPWFWGRYMIWNPVQHSLQVITSKGLQRCTHITETGTRLRASRSYWFSSGSWRRRPPSRHPTPDETARLLCWERSLALLCLVLLMTPKHMTIFSVSQTREWAPLQRSRKFCSSSNYIILSGSKHRLTQYCDLVLTFNLVFICFRRVEYYYHRYWGEQNHSTRREKNV